MSGLARPRARAPLNGRRALLAACAATALVLVAGCSEGSEPAADPVVASAPVGELAGVDGELEVGEEIEVLVDGTGVEWSVSGEAPDAVAVVDEDPEAGSRLVRIVAEAPGSATVEFSAEAEGARDAVDVRVADPR